MSMATVRESGSPEVRKSFGAVVTAICDGALGEEWLGSARVRSPGHGAIASFVGIVRDRARGRGVLWLDYECHRAMAEAQLRRLAAGAAERFDPGMAIVIAHGSGRILPGQASLAIHAASAHRAAANDATRWLIETLKHDLAVWKRETYADGCSDWIMRS